MRKRHKNVEWTNAEVKMLKAGKMPERHTYHAIQMFCSRHGIVFPGKSYQKNNFK
ncbi:hypothetical protein [Fibrobacter sp.]|uniref:hypothetical protein n=1 Tax=Fibrobacter sp. TaxID=35828 RepID=UPI00388FA04E